MSLLRRSFQLSSRRLCGKACQARQVKFSEWGEDDLTALIPGYDQDRDLALAEKWFNSVPPSTESFSVMVAAFCQRDDMVMVVRWVEEMVKKNCFPTVVTFNCIMTSFARQKNLEGVTKWFENMLKAKVQPTQKSFFIAIDAHLAAKKHKEAVEWIETMRQKEYKPSPDIYEQLVLHYASEDNVEEANFWLRSMRRDGEVTPDSYNGILYSHATAGAEDQITAMLAEMPENNCAPNLRSYNAVVCGLAGSRKMPQALSWFAKAQAAGVTPDTVTYNAMIDGFVRVGDMAKAEEWAEQMQAANVPFDAQTYGALITVCDQKDDYTRAAHWYGLAKEAELLDYSGCVSYRRLCDRTDHKEEGVEVERARIRAHITATPPPERRFTAPHPLVAKSTKAQNWHPGKNHATPENLKHLVEMANSNGYEPKLWMYPDSVPDDDRRLFLAHHAEKKALAHALLETKDETVQILKVGAHSCEDCQGFFDAVQASIPEKKIELRSAYGSNKLVRNR